MGVDPQVVLGLILYSTLNGIGENLRNLESEECPSAQLHRSILQTTTLSFIIYSVIGGKQQQDHEVWRALEDKYCARVRAGAVFGVRAPGSDYH